METTRSNIPEEQYSDNRQKASEEPELFEYDEAVFKEFTEKYKQSLKAISSIEEMSELRRKFNKINHSYLPVHQLNLVHLPIQYIQ